MGILDNIFGRSNAAKADSGHSQENESTTNELEQKVRQFMEVLEANKRTAYLPITSEEQNTFSDQSKIGGFPYLRNQDDWPRCPNCNKHLQLFLQLNLSQLPERKESGLAQLFYCTSREPNCETQLKAWEPNSPAVVCRRIAVEGPSASIEPQIDQVFPERLITGWQEKDDYPHLEEYEQLGIDFEDEVQEIIEAKGFGFTIEKDKLFGWPYWVQSVEYPIDKKNYEPMGLLFQLDSEDHLPFMFGDSGIGHLMQGKDREMVFEWAGY